MGAGKLGLIIRVSQIHRSLGAGDKPGNALLIERDTNLLDLVKIEETRVELAFFIIDGVDSQMFGIEHAQDLVLHTD